jgi:simple sugar transport system ATP-binding protein
MTLGQVIGRGTSADLAGEDIRQLMAGGVEIRDRARELAEV